MPVTEKQEEKKVLTICSLVEMGERYVFYTIQSLLVLYLIDELHLPHMTSAKLAGTVFGMVYISALMGGYIAERLLNYYFTIFLGSALLIFGCLLMTAVHTENSLFIGLALISISSGLIKSNVSAFIGKFYDRTNMMESERDFGFNIFYMGINTGILLSTFFAMYFRNKFGFGPTFYISAGMAVFVTAVVIVGFYWLQSIQSNANITLQRFFCAASLILVYVGVVIYILKHPEIANIVFILAALVCVSVMWFSAQEKQWSRVIASLIFFTLSVLYWSLYMQLFISLLLFIHYCVHHTFLGLHINTSQFISVESIFVIIMGVIIGKIWIYFENKNKPVHDIDKFSLSFVLIGLLFLSTYLAIIFTHPQDKIPAFPVIIGVFFMAVSELSLSAIGLSMVTKIAPKGYVSLYMGIWLVTLGLGSKLAGQLSSYINITAQVAQSKLIMSHGLVWYMAICLAALILGIGIRRFAIVHQL